MSTLVRPLLSGVEHPGLVPALLLSGAAGGSTDGDRPPHRSARDWLVDVAAFVLALLVGLVFLAEATVQRPAPPDPLVLADLATGVLGCVALWWRRSRPVGVALLLAAVGTFSDMGGGAGLIALFTVAVHRRWPTVAAVAAVHVASLGVFVVVRPVRDLPVAFLVAIVLALMATMVAWGMFVRARRQLVLSLHERAVRAEAEQGLREGRARQLERTRIAREMHDVLAHRLSLLSMHAGALEFRPDAPPAEIGRAAGVVRATARQALEDLREVIGVLRDSSEDADPDRPQPTLADVPALVEESRSAGLRVSETYAMAELGSAPTVTGRTAYRVVQEGLTNVRKHAAGTRVALDVGGGPGSGLIVELRNPQRIGEGAAAPLPSAGTGLIGLRERVALAGGRLESGWTPAGEFRVHAWLPWPPT